MKILVTGKSGQLGNALKQLAQQEDSYDFTFVDQDDFDLGNLTETASQIRKIKPDILVNCAAYTAVDQAEDEPEKADLLNGEAPGLMAALSSELNFLLIHISTDYVFDGTNHRPYEEDDLFSAPSAYGKSKIQGEENIILSAQRAVIIRTSWLYSATGKNFVKTMLRLGKEKEQLGVVFDQVGTPTYAPDLARVIMQIIRRQDQAEGISIYHYSNEGAISWYDFAKAIMEESGLDCRINAIQSHEFPAKAPRPFYSVLNKARIKEDFQADVPYWKDSLKKCLKELKI